MSEQTHNSYDPTNDDAALEAAHARGHEDDGLFVGRIAATAVSIFLLAVVSLGVVALIMRWWTNPDASSVAAEEEWRALPVDPGVTPDQTAMRKQAARQYGQRLDSYEWQDTDHSVARIPIERAMKLLAEKQLKVFFQRTPAEKPVDESADLRPEAKP